MSNALFIFCVPLKPNTQKKWLYRAVYPAELQLDVGLQNNEAECYMKCMGCTHLETILFLRKQQEYKHDFNELELADQWGATVEKSATSY